MSENQHLELELYFGLCSCWGVSEGRFYGKPPQNDYDKQNRAAAMRVIQQELNSPWEHAIRIGHGMRCEQFVESNEEAQKIIDYAEKNIPNACSVIELVDCMHGNVRFYRKIKFDGATEKQLEGLIEKLKQSGHNVPDEFWKTAFGFGKMYHYRRQSSANRGKN